MKWFKRLRWPSAPDGQEAAESALRRAKAARKEAEERHPAVTEVVGALREFRQENHFAARFRATIEGRSA
ncbi:hypothetical protein ACIOEZ_34235 [Streptomyces sp. NPDC087866]|uniref:DUF7620 family protein n=1 Tax=Streptomyces sp. NPDC087866 TaxID=3365815 RepID=UPI003820CD6F